MDNEKLRVMPVTTETHDLALDISERYGFSIYDSLILTAAILGGCITLFTEDLQNGQCIDDRITLRNPFITN